MAGTKHIAPRRAITPLWRGAAVLIVVALLAVAAAAVLWSRTVHLTAIVGSAEAKNYVATVGDESVVTSIPDSSGAAPHQALVAAVITDLAAYWATELPAMAGQPFTTLRGGITAIDSAVATRGAPCVRTPSHIAGNAFYCPSADSIVYDSAALVPVLLDRYGAAGLTATFAHEYGHAIQARLEQTSPRSEDAPRSPLIREAQADCYAGAFLAWVTSGQAPHLKLGAETLARAIGPLVDFADAPTISPTDPTAHGLAIDRATWMLLGFRGGADRCPTMTNDTLSPILGMAGRFDDTTSSTPRRYATEEAVLTAADRSVTDFLDTHATATAEVHSLAAVAPHGQFAEATVLAQAFGAAVIDGAPHPPPAAEAVVDAACVAGAWVGSVYGRVGGESLGSWRGDVDAGLDAIRLLPHASFSSIAAYVDGFHDGIHTCDGV